MQKELFLKLAAVYKINMQNYCTTIHNKDTPDKTIFHQKCQFGKNVKLNHECCFRFCRLFIIGLNLFLLV